MNVQFPEYLRRVEEVLVVKNPNPPQSQYGYMQGILSRAADFLALKPSRGRLRRRAIQYPLTRKRTVRKAWTAASGMM